MVKYFIVAVQPQVQVNICDKFKVTLFWHFRDTAFMGIEQTTRKHNASGLSIKMKHKKYISGTSGC